MRTVGVAILCAVLLAPACLASPPNPALLVVQEMTDGTRLLLWSPVTEAQLYIIHRGPTLETMEPIMSTEQTYFLDDAPLGGESAYGVSVWDGKSFSDLISTQSSGGNCASVRPDGKFSVTASNCVNY